MLEPDRRVPIALDVVIISALLLLANEILQRLRRERVEGIKRFISSVECRKRLSGGNLLAPRAREEECSKSARDERSIFILIYR